MSQENVDVVVGYFTASDLADAFEAVSEDVTFAFHGETRHLSGAEAIAGKSAALGWMVDWFSRFSDYHFEIDEALDFGERVLAVTTHNARGRTSGAPIRRQTAQVLTVRDGKIAHQDFYASREDALAATGLRSSASDEKR